jgi:hypothetical protein
MKVVCIRRCDFGTFTIKPGDCIEVDDAYPLTYSFERDGHWWIWKERFITLEQSRERKIKKILDN